MARRTAKQPTGRVKDAGPVSAGSPRWPWACWHVILIAIAVAIMRGATSTNVVEAIKMSSALLACTLTGL